ncbi:eCIS core domain-containing protein [Nostoc sp.]|uniref:eCIS core domain-containing protein n=1 Tax=Nostoc sp. TaxID=1180 RepID=UPI002FF92C7D
MHNKRLSKTPSSINTNSQAVEQNPKLAYRPFGSQIQKASAAPITQQSTKEDVAFAEQKMEAFGLELQAKYGKITPEGQERLTVLQAKMDGLLNSQLQQARRFSHNIANIPLTRPDRPTPIQAKLTIGEPGDKYEQEADETARQVVQRIHQPQSDKLQRESLPENDQLQMKPERPVQREALLEDNQMQMKPMVQRRALDAGIVASANLERSIQQAQGSGQPLADSIKSPMEMAFGADFSGVKVHTDGQSDQLNRSIQARAFTTGQDVFFRQGEYNPGNRGGQELLAHELTHVVQQNASRVQLQEETRSIQAKGSGQSLAENIREPMEPGREIVQRVVSGETQPTGNVCWAAVGYAIHKHKGGQQYTDLRTFVQNHAKADVLKIFDQNKPTDIDRIIGEKSNTNRLKGSDSEGSYYKSAVTRILNKDQPIVANVNGNHYIILTERILNNGTYQLRYMDPADGQFHTLDAVEDPSDPQRITGVGNYRLSVLYYTN